VLGDLGPQRVIEPDAPGRTGGQLLAGDEPVGQPPVDGGDPDAQFGGGLGDADHLAIMTGRCGSLAERGDAVVAAHLGDPGLGEGQAGAGAAVLAGEHARDGCVVVVRGQAADQVHGGRLGGPPRGAEPGQRHGAFGDCSAFPAQRERGGAGLPVHGEGDLG